MTAKKLIIILIISVISCTAIGTTIFLISNANKTIYATEIKSSENEIAVYVGDEFYIYDKLFFEILPSNCTQSIKFSISNNSVCSLETSKRKIKAKSVGTCTLRASIKNSESEYISTNINIIVSERENQNEIYATSIENLKENICLSVNQNIKIDEFFAILPQNCTKNMEFLIENDEICNFDPLTNYLTATNSGTTKITANILKNSTEYLTSEINIYVFENQTNYALNKNLSYDENSQNIIILYLSNDVPELVDYENLEFVYSYNSQQLEILEVETNIIKLKCKTFGNFDFVLSNAGFLITYNISATQQSLNVATNTSTIALSVGETYNLNDIEFENLPNEYQIDFSASTNIATIQNQILTATNIGTFQLTATITHQQNQQNIFITVSISKATIQQNLYFNLVDSYATIDLSQNQIVQNLSIEFQSTEINIQDSTALLFENLEDNILTITFSKKGSTTISINSNLVEIILNVTIS